jgi:hypothetical protein
MIIVKAVILDLNYVNNIILENNKCYGKIANCQETDGSFCLNCNDGFSLCI